MEGQNFWDFPFGGTVLDWLLVVGTTALFALLASMARLPMIEISMHRAIGLVAAMLGMLFIGGVALWRVTRFQVTVDRLAQSKVPVPGPLVSFNIQNQLTPFRTKETSCNGSSSAVCFMLLTASAICVHAQINPYKGRHSRRHRVSLGSAL